MKKLLLMLLPCLLYAQTPVITSIEPTNLYFKGDFLIASDKVATWNADTVAMASETDSSFILTVTPKGNNLPDTLGLSVGTQNVSKVVKYKYSSNKLTLGVR